MGQREESKPTLVQVLKIYLRGYYSQFHHCRPWCNGKHTLLDEIYQYWSYVETGKYMHDLQDMTVAQQLKWSRSELKVDINTLTKLTAKLAFFEGLITLRQTATKPCIAHLFRPFSYRKNLQQLDMRGCIQTTCTNDVFRHLTHLKFLNMDWCKATKITNDAFYHLQKLKCLSMAWCNQTTITDEAFSHLTNLERLNMQGCKQTTISDEAFRHLKKLKHLDISGCKQKTITDKAFVHLTCLQSLSMSRRNGAVTDRTFSRLTNLERLDMSVCNQTTISNKAFMNLSNVRCLTYNALFSDDDIE